MQTLASILAVVALTLTSTLFATLYQANDYSSSWASNSAWTAGSGFPSTPADEAYFPEPSTNRTMIVPAATTGELWQGACTAAVVTMYGSSSAAVNVWKLNGNSGSGRINLLVLTNANGNARICCKNQAVAAQSTLLDISLKIQLNQPTDVICSGGYFRLMADFNGSQPMNFIGSGGHVQAYTGSSSPNYTGDINVYGNYTEYYSGSFFNATYLLRAGGVLANQYGQRALMTKLRALETSQLSIGGVPGSESVFYKDVAVENGAVLTASYGSAGITSKFLANVKGNGTLFFALASGLNTNFFTGSITPGLDGVGKLTMDKTVSATKSLSNYFGIAGDNLELGIEVTGSGGVPGSDYDQLELLNMNGDVDLATVNLNFTALSNNAEISWFLKSNTQLLNDFANVTGTNGLQIAFFGKSGDGFSYGILVGIPEPALAAAVLLALLPLRHRFCH